ncbi:MAG TPA: hypothetical protein VK431_00500 [Nitrosopumilaceae archaeon]|nr:hypothetical protein [Nitrosopumilaceae archaeon]
MNKSYAVSRFFAVASLVFIGNVCAVDVKEVFVRMVEPKKNTLGAIFLATALPNRSAKVTAETIGFGLDNPNADVAVLAENWMANYLLRYAFDYAAKQGCSIDVAIDKVVPSTVGDDVKAALKETVKAAAPQLLAGAIVDGVNSLVSGK